MSHNFHDNLLKSIHQHKVLTEDCLQVRVVYELYQIIESPRYYDDWRVFSKKYVKTASQKGHGKYPDVCCMRFKEHRIYMELKHDVFRSKNKKEIVEDMVKLAEFANDGISCIMLLTIHEDLEIEQEWRDLFESRGFIGLYDDHKKVEISSEIHNSNMRLLLINSKVKTELNDGTSEEWAEQQCQYINNH